MRVGIGFDAHRLVEGRRFVLGGVEIPSDVGPMGHSDADVLAHALMDAILSAMRAGDIGRHFPDSDAAYEGASSIELLERVAQMMREADLCLVDADCVVVLESPKVSPFREAMRGELARALGVTPECVGVKATTTEGMGFTGTGEGVAAYAVVLLDGGA